MATILKRVIVDGGESIVVLSSEEALDKRMRIERFEYPPGSGRYLDVWSDIEPLGAKLKQLRKAKGFSLEKLANQTGMSKSYIWELENRPGNPTTEKITKLADALGVTTAYLTENARESHDRKDN